MKKTTIAIALFLTIAMLLPCFTACNLGGNNNETTAPVTTATPTSDPAVTTAEPDVTTVANITTAVDITTAVVTTSPEATTAPEVTTAPDVTTAPEAITAPEVTTAPEATTAPVVTTTPEVTTAPEIATAETENTVTIIIPESFFDDEEQRKNYVDKAQENGFLSCVSNPDNSVTVTMTRSKQQELLEECKKTIDTALSEVNEPDNTSSITGITYNDDITEFTVLVDKDKYTIFDAFYAIPLYSMGYYYQLIDGKTADDIDVLVKFCNKDNTAEVLNTGSYKKYLEENPDVPETTETTEPQCNHSFESVVVQPTYYEKGYTTHTCKICGYSYIDSEVDKLTYPLSNQVICDENNVKLTIKNIEIDSWGYFCINVEIENNTAKKLMFSWNDVSVNNYMIDPFWATEIDAGNKIVDSISFSKSQFEDNGIIDVHLIEFRLTVYDSDDWLADYIINKSYAIYPLNETAASIKFEDRTPVDGEVVVVDNKNIKFVIEKNYNDSIWGYSLTCYIENKTDKDLMFSFNDVSVNDCLIDPYWSKTVIGGKKARSTVSFSDTDLKNCGITAVSKIVFTLVAYDDNDWLADNLYSAQHTYLPK